MIETSVMKELTFDKLLRGQVQAPFYYDNLFFMKCPHWNFFTIYSGFA